MKLPLLSRLFSSASSRDEAGSPNNSGEEKENAETFSGSDEHEWIRQVVEETYSELGVFVRDVNLSKSLEEKYTVGLIIREPGTVDASRRIGGMATTHRFAILSNHMKSLEDFDFENRGLCVAMGGSYFKVVETHTYKDKTFILLLHLPDGDAWRIFPHVRVNIENTLKGECIQRLEEKCGEPVIPELAAEEWLGRCAHPVGMDEQGEYFPLEQ
ncbi:MAG: hypothetical protein LBS65_11520 [Desulfovibrio sp.]|jgi:hypothetical protein|nr:hypothetical protein [Desulfovibrio sp.]